MFEVTVILICLLLMILNDESYAYRMLQVNNPGAKDEGYCTNNPKTGEKLCEDGKYFNAFEGLQKGFGYEGFVGYYVSFLGNIFTFVD